MKKLYTLALCLVLFLGLSFGVAGRTVATPLPQTQTPVYIYFFWGDGCPHCAQAKPFLQELAQRYPNVQVESFEVWYVPDNQALFQLMAAAHNFEPRYVPTIFIGGRQWEGFSDALRAEIEAYVKACVETGCPDAGAGIVPGHAVATETPAASEVCNAEATECDAAEDGHTLPGPPSTAGTRAVVVALFYGDAGCLQCDANKENPVTERGLQALRFLEELDDQYQPLEVKTYEVWLSPANAARLRDIAKRYGVAEAEVPVIFAGDRVWQGFDAEIAQDLQVYVEHCLDVGCSGPLDTMVSESPQAAVPVETALTGQPSETTITIPLLGAVDLGALSLWVSTALIAIVDGFNPCSLWVLSILIALTLRTGSRKKIFIIGLTFITVTALVYVLFIAGLFTMLTFVRFLGWIQAAVSLLALFFAAINIKDYFWYKEGLSFTIDDAQKPGLYKRMRRVLQAGDSLGALLLATVGLAVGVSLVEFSCTAGFPVLWTNLVAAQAVTPLTFALLLLLYMVIYQIDELGIFLAAVITLRVSKLEEKHGRILKLIGGTLMLTLAAVMLIKPALMNDLGSSVIIFGVAFGAALLVLLAHRVILPRLGVRIGTETLD